jgi:hypothetical protein
MTPASGLVSPPCLEWRHRGLGPAGRIPGQQLAWAVFEAQRGRGGQVGVVDVHHREHLVVDEQAAAQDQGGGRVQHLRVKLYRSRILSNTEILAEIFPYTAKTKCRKFKTNIPRKGISGPQSQFPHSCVYWGLGRAIPRKGIYKRNCCCSV